jgi:hypothetical protein
MFKCPNCSPQCPTYDEANGTCMHNTKLIEPEEAIKAYWTNPAAAFDELD